MSVERTLQSWRTNPDVGGNVEAWREIPARLPQTAPLPKILHPSLQAGLEHKHIRSLYVHQAQSWEYAQQGRSLVVVTGTASGKSLCYNLPVLQRLQQDPQARALYIFPTKALAQDQAEALRAFLPGLPIAIYDGDTPSGNRPAIRQNARLILTNPDMLHTGILPHHTRWAEFFTHLSYVVLDEMHVYRGVFGSHVANVIRRLKRVSQVYGTRPQFILTSATIGNPLELASRLVEEELALVDQDGAARGPKNFLIYNPPVVDAELGLRRSALQETIRLSGDLLDHGIQTIVFARSRRTVELILSTLRQGAMTTAFSSRQETETAIRGYRSGYLASQRREIERGLREGAVRAVIATNALELGIDIGGLEASLLVGYPGTVAAAWQQAGRAGRGLEPSLTVLVATPDPLDQFLARNPAYFFDRPVEQGLINPDNLLILLNHIRCAAFELPFQSGECYGSLSATATQEMLDFLEQQGVLHHSGTKYFWMADQYPAQEVSLRSASPDRVVLQAVDAEGVPATIGEVDRASAPWMVHPEAIYLHEGQTFLVDSLDLEAGNARLRSIDCDYYTEPRSETTVELIEKTGESRVSGGWRSQGEIKVTTQVVGYKKVRWMSHEPLGMGELILPPSELVTTGYWITLSESSVNNLREQGLWSNDPNNYGPNWRARRDQARARDQYRCQVCGAPETERTHDVHHKVPFRTFPSWEQANRLENLVTLCPACHRRVETGVRVRSGLAGLSYVLGHLAPFFLMCDPRDLGVHSDPQSPLAEAQPTVVLYDLVPAGIGFSARLFELHSELLGRALDLVRACPCTDGCPSCVGPGGENGQGGKAETLAILEAIQ